MAGLNLMAYLWNGITQSACCTISTLAQIQPQRSSVEVMSPPRAGRHCPGAWYCTSATGLMILFSSMPMGWSWMTLSSTVWRRQISSATVQPKASWASRKKTHQAFGKRLKNVSRQWCRSFSSASMMEGSLTLSKPVDLPSFQRISNILLPQLSQPFRNVPIRIFLPLPPDAESSALKVVQSPLPPSIPASNMQSSQVLSSRLSPTSQPQTVGTVLHTLLPNLFPSRRTPVLAKPVLHGAVLPMSAPIEEVVRSSAYGDGWAYLVVRMMGWAKILRVKRLFVRGHASNFTSFWFTISIDIDCVGGKDSFVCHYNANHGRAISRIVYVAIEFLVGSAE